MLLQRSAKAPRRSREAARTRRRRPSLLCAGTDETIQWEKSQGSRYERARDDLQSTWCSHASHRSASEVGVPSPAPQPCRSLARTCRPRQTKERSARPTHRAECSPGTSRSFSWGMHWSSGSPGDTLPPPGDAASAEDLSGVAGSAYSVVKGSAAAASEGAGE